jgi:hypothetical protein
VTSRARVLLLAAILGGGACVDRSAIRIVGESYKRKDREAVPKSRFFDGKTLALRGARGEVLGVQIIAAGVDGQAVRLTLPKEIARVEGFRVHTIKVSEPSTAMYGQSRGAGVYPDALEPIDAPVVTGDAAYFDVTIARGAKIGHYTGLLELGSTRIAVELRVDPVSIDLEHDSLVWTYYMPRELARAHGLADDDSPAELALERRYRALFAAHGIELASDMPPARFPPRREFMKGARYYPVYVDTSSPDKIAADVAYWERELKAESAVPFVIPIDEPSTAAERARLRSIGLELAHAGAGRARLLRAVTAARSPDLDGAIDVFIAPTDRARPGPHFWTYNGKPPEAGSMIIDTDGIALRTRGWIAFRYGVELWYIWEGMYFTDRYNGGSVTDVWHQPITFDQRRNGSDTDFGNGDGLLAYPNAVPSLRLKALRRGILDRLLLRKLASCGGAARAAEIARRMIPRALAEGQGAAAWSTDEDLWEAARREVLDELGTRCPDGA